MKSRRRSRDWMEDFAWWGVFYHGVRKRRHRARREYVDSVHLGSVSLITFWHFLILICLLGFRSPFTATRESSWDTRHRTLTPSSNTPSPQFVQGLRQYFPIREKHDWSGSPNFLGSSVSIHPSIAPKFRQLPFQGNKQPHISVRFKWSWDILKLVSRFTQGLWALQISNAGRGTQFRGRQYKIISLGVGGDWVILISKLSLTFFHTTLYIFQAWGAHSA